MANFAANSIMGNNTSSAATPLALSAGQTKSLLSLNNVENTAVSSWAGTTNITTLGTITSGTWTGSVVASAYLDGDTMHLSESQTITGAKTFGTTTKLFFHDSSVYIHAGADANLDLVADSEIHLDAPALNMDGAMDISGDLTLSGEDGALTFDAASSIKIVDNNSAALVIEEANNAYMTFDSRDGVEIITAHKDLGIGGSIVHDGDSDCKIEFDTDTIKLTTGGTARVTATNATTTVSNNLAVTGTLTI